ncbi:MAG: hypothetical protein ACK40D_06745 [Cyanobacteriota bacterium]
MSRADPQRALWTLAGLSLLALALQQALLRQPPRLLQLSQAPASSGPAALRLRFSRPMDPASLAASRLDPPLAHRWLGDGDTLLLSLAPGQRLAGPLRLTLAGRDLAGVPLTPRRWLWDPRPRLLAVVPLPGGDQLQWRDHDGHWRPLLPRVWPQIVSLEALGDGTALALVSREQDGMQQVWRLPLQQRNLAPEPRGLAPLRAGAPRALTEQPLLFAHISGNSRGELLVQAGGVGGGSVLSQLWPPQGSPRSLELEAMGTASLLPEGGAVVVPRNEGLTLDTLPPPATQAADPAGQPRSVGLLPPLRPRPAAAPLARLPPLAGVARTRPAAPGALAGFGGSAGGHLPGRRRADLGGAAGRRTPARAQPVGPRPSAQAAAPATARGLGAGAWHPTPP